VDDFDALYDATPEYFGAEPEPSLRRFFHLLDPSRRVLDVGCGQGRNTFFLAHRGYGVDALDPSRVATRQVEGLADEHGLAVRAICGLFQDLESDVLRYGGILLFGLIPLLGRAEIKDLPSLVKTHLDTGGLCFATAFGTWDPDHSRRAESWAEEGRHSFRSPDGRLRTYLESGELAALFGEFSIVHSWEGLTPEHRHGDRPVERHGIAEGIFRCP
jgi:cyclopropane fatty-acyl-phospholipid synthase-like methyltransferase